MKTGLYPLRQGIACLMCVIGACACLALADSDVPPAEAPKATATGKDLGRVHDFGLEVFSYAEIHRMEQYTRYRFFGYGNDSDLPVTEGLTVGQAVTNYTHGEWRRSRQLRLVRRNVILQTDGITGQDRVLPGGGSLLDVKVEPGDVIVMVGVE